MNSIDERHCSFEDEALSYASGEIAPEDADRVVTHMASCAICIAQVALYARLLEEDETEEEAATIDALAHATEATVLGVVPGGQRRSEKPRWSPWLGRFGAIAATAIVAFGIWWWIARPSGPSDLERGRQALASALAKSRPSEMRLTGVPYSPARAARGGAAGRADAAESWLRAAVAEDPTPEALHELGKALLVQGDAAGARSKLEAARNEAPDDLDVTVDFAVALAEAGDYDGARDALDRVLARDPKQLEALFDRALVLERLGQVDDARGAWARYLEVDESSPWAAEARRRLERLGV